MPTKYIPLPPKNIGGFISSCYNNKLSLMTVIPPHPVSVPLKMTREGIRTAINDYFCYNCKFRISKLDEQAAVKGLTPIELSRYCREKSKCPGSKRFATPGCLAGYNKESNMFQLANAEFTTPFIGLDTRYTLSNKGSLTQPDHFWKCFQDHTLKNITIYNNFNVFVQGNTCWGARGTPLDPASAYNEFFNSLTNGDLTSLSGHSLKYAIENWDANFNNVGWKETAEQYPVSNILSRLLTTEDNAAAGVLISNNANWVTNVSKSELITIRGIDYFIGWVRNTSTGTQVICSKHLVYIMDGLTSTRKMPMLLGRRKELNL